MTIITAISIVVFLLLLITFMIRRFIVQKKNVPGELYAEALRNENSGFFEMAIDRYEKALSEASKTWYQDNNLKFKIIAKLKVLHTVIDYKNGFHTGR